MRKTTLYRSRSGNIVKEIHARGVRAARSAELELEALQLFGGGDVIALMDSKVKRLGEDGAFVSLEVEAADGNLRRRPSCRALRGSEYGGLAEHRATGGGGRGKRLS